jgi:probable F420-dependent oxidoreductase
MTGERPTEAVRGGAPGVCLPHRQTSAAAALRLAGRAEELGFDSVWVSELATYDAIALSAAIAARTQRVAVGIVIVPATTRTPALHAMSLSTLGWLLPGRCKAGFGVSTRTVIDGWHGQELRRPVAEMRDLFTILDQAWGGEATHYAGERRRSHGFRLEAPAPDPPRRYVGALGPRMRAFARERADGLLLNLSPRSRLRAIAAAERPRDEFEVALPIRVAVKPDAEARRRFRREAASYLRVEAYAAAITDAGYGDVVGRVAELDSLEAMAEALPQPFVDDLWLAGTGDECRAGLERIREDGVTPLIVPVTPPGDAEAFEATIAAIG